MAAKVGIGGIWHETNTFSTEVTGRSAFEDYQLHSVGIEPEAMRIIVAKSAIGWRAAYGSIAKQAITVDSPGIATSNLARLPFKKRPNPLDPLEPDGFSEILPYDVR